MWNLVIVLVLGRMRLYHKSGKNCTKNTRPLTSDILDWCHLNKPLTIWPWDEEDTHLPWAAFKIIAARLGIWVLLNTLNELLAAIAKLAYCSRS